MAEQKEKWAIKKLIEKNMKKLLKTILLGLLMLFGYQPKCEAVEVQVSDNNDLLRLIEAIATIESDNNSMAFNASENAVGILQIRPIMVLEVNRICELLKLPLKFVDEDRWDAKESRRMALIYFSFWRNYHHLTQQEQIVALWCAGPDGWRQLNETKVKDYVKNVKRIMETN